ncbi:MAG: FecR family protein [Steroidobacteraceae bacterium]
MSASHTGKCRPSATARAEAAAWIARLHGPNRTREVEEGLRRWLQADAEHTAAFEVLTDIWEKTARLSRARKSTAPRTLARLSLARALLAMILVAFVGQGFFRGTYTEVVASGIGQFRTITLADGTRIRLDADSRLIIRYSRRARHVALADGQAYFAVTHRSTWPFVVTAAGHVIRDLGTEFDVRREGDVLAVTLVEGKVTVSAARADDPAVRRRDAAVPADFSAGLAASGVEHALTLSPGERVTFEGTRAARVDWPRLGQVMAWEHREVVLDNTSLGQAVRELNRYSPQRIVIDDPAVAAIRVSGIVQAGASSSFAAAVAKAYQLSASRPARNVIVLARGH